MLGHVQGLENLQFEDDWSVLSFHLLRLGTRFGLISHIVKLSRILGKELMGHVELRTQLCVIALETPLKASKQRGNVATHCSEGVQDLPPAYEDIYKL